MKILDYFILVIILCFSCSERKNVELYQTHIMCVYWTDFVQRNFETPAIAYKLSLGSSDWCSTCGFFVQDTVNNSLYPLKKLKIIYKTNFVSLGLSLDSRFMQQFYIEKINVTNNCYEEELKTLYQDSRIIAINKKDTIVINRSANHILYQGVREYKK